MVQLVPLFVTFVMSAWKWSLTSENQKQRLSLRVCSSISQICSFMFLFIQRSHLDDDSYSSLFLLLLIIHIMTTESADADGAKSAGDGRRVYPTVPRVCIAECGMYCDVEQLLLIKTSI